MLKVWIYIVLMLAVLVVAFLITRVLKKMTERKRLEAEERIRKLSESEEGREQLEREAKEREEKFGRRLPAIMVAMTASYVLMLILGIVGLVMLVSGIIRGEKISRLVGGGNGLLVLSPLIVFVSASRLIDIFRKR
ncbi:MAG: hypothetical protein II054_07565 [Treponema sp.]|nr:hypothetical protein [Treponema sp.]MBR6295473.1 hypothetical protein [Treponema sp.]